jgi:hypothetical protein
MSSGLKSYPRRGFHQVSLKSSKARKLRQFGLLASASLLTGCASTQKIDEGHNTQVYFGTIETEEGIGNGPRRLEYIAREWVALSVGLLLE